MGHGGRQEEDQRVELQARVRMMKIALFMTAALALAAFASADMCDNIKKCTIDGFHFGNGVGEITDAGWLDEVFNVTSGEWEQRVFGVDAFRANAVSSSTVFSAVGPSIEPEACPFQPSFFTLDSFDNHEDIDGDGDVDGIDPNLEKVLSARDLGEDGLPTGEMLNVTRQYKPLCMWTSSGAGPTGYGFVCANQDDNEILTGFITECDEEGRIIGMRLESLEARNGAADALASQILGDGFLHESGAPHILYMELRGEPGPGGDYTDDGDNDGDDGDDGDDSGDDDGDDDGDSDDN